MHRKDCLDALYRVFAKYPRFEGYVGCTHCVSEEEQDRLRPVPLREIGVTLLRPVAYNAGVGTFGDVSDYKHFLPRMCELLLTKEGRSSYVESFVFAGLRLYSFETWAEDEQQAVLCYLQAWIGEKMEEIDDLMVDSTICFLRDMASIFPSQALLVDAVRGLSDLCLAKLFGHMCWRKESLEAELLDLWKAFQTAEIHRRLLPVLESLPKHADLSYMLSDFLADLPTS